VLAREIRILNEAKTPPFQIAEDGPVSEDVRLRYRYLDLRRPRLQTNIGLRHRVSMAIRKYFDANGFWEIETPILAKSTPEGARDFLVPSRVHAGEFYALPQSPQIFKQILMIAGTDRYFQIVRCFRDEDQRADRQLEFTQVDVEISFARPELVYGLIEPLMPQIFKEIGSDVKLPIRRMPYAEAIARYGSDKPDLRCGLEIVDLSDAFREAEFRVFKQIIAEGGVVRGFNVPGANRYTRSQAGRARRSGEADGVHRLDLGPARRAAVVFRANRSGEATLRPALEQAKVSKDDLLLMAAGPADGHVEAAWHTAAGDCQERESAEPGGVRVPVGHRLSAPRVQRRGRTLVFDAPSVHGAARRRRRQGSNPIRAASAPRLRPGPQRIRDRRRQRAYPRRGAAGADLPAPRHQRRGRRSCASASFWRRSSTARRRTAASRSASTGSSQSSAGESSIREVIAFPKTANAVDLMAGAPSIVDAKQLRELHLKIQKLN
jgi:aspartyl-tRNA synthetase